MAERRAIRDIANPHETLLVADASPDKTRWLGRASMRGSASAALC